MEALRSHSHTGRLRRAVRIIIPAVMLSVGAYLVVNGGVGALVAMLPILGAHVVVFAGVYPLWRHFRRRQSRPD